ncbi:MAG: biotin--[acetyl-CoA-carboxylase] ligase [Alphaproteobacteria bacterium]|nr:biotin--[acetyl-CoA-carboxylase] ligase [Alphaproteobacteria bacterium]
MSGQFDLPSYCTPVLLEQVDSTNEEAKRLAADGAPHLTLVVARHQTKGRGRQGRAWVSPPGNLYSSLVLRPDCSPAVAAQIGFVAALATRDVIVDFTHGAVDVRCKWPNDVLIDGRKVCGFLLESAALGADRVDWLVLGLGVNLVSAPVGIDRPATCLADNGVTSCLPEDFLQAWIPTFVHWYSRWRKLGFRTIRETWLSHAIGRGEPIEVRLGGETIRGLFADLDRSGALIVDQSNVRRTVTAGDVFALGN